jgi:hypothetical protein
MIANFLDDINEQAYLYVTSLPCVTAEIVGLDPRAGCHIYLDSDAVVVDDASAGKLKYYGGFEYVDQELVSVIGQYTFYRVDDSCTDCRVQACLDAARKNYQLTEQ